MFRSIVSKYILCLLLLSSLSFCASGVSDKKSCDGILTQYEFQLTQDKEKNDWNITIYFNEISREIGDVDFVIEPIQRRMCINLIMINVNFQLRGLGSILLQLAIKIAHDSNCQKIELRAEPITSVPEEYQADLKRLVAWYKCFGFEPQKQDAYCRDVLMMAKAPFKLDLVPLPKIT